MIVQRAADDKPGSFMKSKELIALASGLPLLEIASLLVRLDHAASVIVNANHSIM
jgi:hypothetical protein